MVNPSDFYDNYIVEWVSEAIIRHEFNSREFEARTEAGEFERRLENYNKHLKPYARRKINLMWPDNPATKCTRSQMISYRTQDGDIVALAHRLIREDSTLAASGRPDPKRLYIDGRLIAIRASGTHGDENAR